MEASKNRENSDITQEEFRELSIEGKILRTASNLVPPPGKAEDQVLDSLLKKIGQDKPVKTFTLGRWLRAAAAIFILAFSVYAINSYSSNERITAEFGELSECTLPDGSEVFLNAGSKIRWHKKNFPDKRQVILKGEAFFDVQKGGEFLIKTKNGNIEILGTKLNVFARPGIFRVSCLEGKVKVISAGSEQILLPGEAAELTPDGLEKISSYNVENTILWKQGIFYFEEKPLVPIFEEIERQFDVSIKHKGIEGRLITVSFSNKDLKEALDVVCIPMGLGYEIKKNKKVIIFDTQD